MFPEVVVHENAWLISSCLAHGSTMYAWDWIFESLDNTRTLVRSDAVRECKDVWWTCGGCHFGETVYDNPVGRGESRVPVQQL